MTTNILATKVAETFVAKFSVIIIRPAFSP